MESLVIDECNMNAVCYPLAVGLKDFLQVDHLEIAIMCFFFSCPSLHLRMLLHNILSNIFVHLTWYLVAFWTLLMTEEASCCILAAHTALSC